MRRKRRNPHGTLGGARPLSEGDLRLGWGTIKARASRGPYRIGEWYVWVGKNGTGYISWFSPGEEYRTHDGKTFRLWRSGGYGSGTLHDYGAVSLSEIPQKPLRALQHLMKKEGARLSSIAWAMSNNPRKKRRGVSRAKKCVYKNPKRRKSRYSKRRRGR